MNVSFGHQLLHIYGPFAIHSYGLFIALGLVITLWAIRRNKRFKQLNLEKPFLTIVMVAIVAAYIGGRALSIISEPEFFTTWIDWFAFWQPGFSILGSILGVLIILPLYLKKIKIPTIPFFDLISIYGPLLQAISRIGCFFAGCCFVAHTS